MFFNCVWLTIFIAMVIIHHKCMRLENKSSKELSHSLEPNGNFIKLKASNDI